MDLFAHHPCERRDPVSLPRFEGAGLPPAAGNFLCWHKESHQRNAFSKLTAQPVDSTTRGFSDSPSWLGRKTACIHARRPPGLLAAGSWGTSSPTKNAARRRRFLFDANPDSVGL